MFEQYTERARRVVFFARYEASQFGSMEIETHHFLLGLIREDKNLTNHLLRTPRSIESIRKEIEERAGVKAKVPTSIDLPLSTESKRVLAYAAEEAEMLNHGWIGTEHLFLGLLREESGLAATILRERGLKLESLREELARDFAKTQTHRESLPIDTMFVEALERHGLSAAKEHFVRCWNAKNEGNLEEARKELQVFLTSLMDSIQKQAPGEDVLAPIFKGFDWRQSPQQLHTGLPAEEDWTLRMLFTCLLAELLMKRLDQRKPPG